MSMTVTLKRSTLAGTPCSRPVWPSVASTQLEAYWSSWVAPMRPVKIWPGLSSRTELKNKKVHVQVDAIGNSNRFKWLPRETYLFSTWSWDAETSKIQSPSCHSHLRVRCSQGVCLAFLKRLKLTSRRPLLAASGLVKRAEVVSGIPYPKRCRCCVVTHHLVQYRWLNLPFRQCLFLSLHLLAFSFHCMHLIDMALVRSPYVVRRRGWSLCHLMPTWLLASSR